MLCRKNSVKIVSGSAPVYLNVYDLTSINGYAYWLGLGAYHSGVQVHGIEYAFGAHEYPTTGIFEGEPKQCDGFTFRKAILIGWTEKGPLEVRGVMEELAQVYKGSVYNLITKNCNHFCNDACVRLTGNPIPSWVNRLARIAYLMTMALVRGDQTKIINRFSVTKMTSHIAERLFCNCIVPARLNSTKVGNRRIEDKLCEADKKKLTSGSSRFTSSSDSSSSSNSSSSPAAPARSRRSVLPSSPLIVVGASS
ncbi:hypothetical protein RHGRI_024765 [Rhododendron griersonianum]|uniref:PPPDE domain-containing protein n=1 Tax=Rhododendron griersonianum TaxID=479676 RepID=A0AAV6J8N9_9ERIC|nr:hypothetical protein RHGRI_024765 [Rhododendron griersonianum]